MTLTAEMFAGLTTGLTDAIEVLVPIGIGVMVIYLIAGAIPRVIKKFARF